MGNNAGFADPAVAGYFSRGDNSGTVFKWAFPSDAVSVTTSAPVGMRYHAGFADPAVAGYFSSGEPIYKWAFPSDAVSVTTSAPVYLNLPAGFANA